MRKYVLPNSKPAAEWLSVKNDIAAHAATFSIGDLVFLLNVPNGYRKIFIILSVEYLDNPSGETCFTLGDPTTLTATGLAWSLDLHKV